MVEAPAPAMSSHHAAAAAALLLIESLIIVVALSGADARSTVLPYSTPAALPGANDVHGQGLANASPDSVQHELCNDCEESPAPPPCSCEEPKEDEMTCNKVHAVRDGETCYSMWQCAGLGQDDFLRFNPNICCDHLFVGQWVCLDATC